MVNFKERLVSLDVFRGLTMAAMILVENPGNWSIYKPLSHARWGMLGDDGLPVHQNITPTDLIMPFFLFIVGVSIVFALWNKRKDESLHRSTIMKITGRSAKLFVLGLVFYAFPSILNSLLYGGEINIVVMGVLQRIALVYFASAIIFLKWKPKTIVWASVVTLLAYWACTYIPVPGYADPQFFRQYFTPDNIPSSFPEWVDAKILGFAHPAGIVSTFPAIVTGLMGVLTGIYLKTEKNQTKLVSRLLMAGVVLLIVGYGWSYYFPIIKDLWTSSYTLVAGGYGLIVFAFVYWLVDVKKNRFWTPPFIAYGVNCISVYFISHIVGSTLWVLKIASGESSLSLHEWINNNCFETWLSPINASLAFALSTVVLWFIPLWVMYKKKIFIRV